MGNGCIRSAVLTKCFLGKLSDTEQDSVLAHIDACTDCQAAFKAIEEHPPRDWLIDELRQPPNDLEFEDETALHSALRKSLALAELTAEGRGQGKSSDRRSLGKSLGQSLKRWLPGALRRPAMQPAPNRFGGRLPVRIGQFVLRERLGRGGMGAVYKGEDTATGRIVAVKVLRPERAGSAEAMLRFRQEWSQSAQLDHPNIVTVYHAAEIDGVPCLVMKFIEGINLAALVTAIGRLPFGQACEIVRQAADALNHIHKHSRELVHRDLKPSNFMLDFLGRVVLLDFGLAYSRNHRAGAGDLTRDGQILGTVEYMAPEQFIDSRSVDIRADIYSLGCTLFELLAGKPAFSARGARDAMAFLQAHLSNIPVLPDDIASQVPDGVVEMVRRALEKRPDDRFQSPAEFRDALQQFAAAGALDELCARGREVQAENPPDELDIPIAMYAAGPHPHWDANDEHSRSIATYPGSERSPRRTRIVVAIASVTCLLMSLAVAVRDRLPAIPKQDRSQLESETNREPTSADEGILALGKVSSEMAGVDERRDSAEFQPLFNGRDTQGWTLAGALSANVSVADGVLSVQNRGPPCHLFTDRCDYENFHFRCEFMCEKGGEIAAVLGRTDPSPIVFGGMRGYLVSVGRLASAAPGDAKALTRLLLASRERAAFELARSEHGMLAPNRWHKLDIVMTGPRIQAFVDGELMIDQVDEGRVFERGALALEFPLNTSSRYRNIEVQDLGPTPKKRVADHARARCVVVEYFNVWNEIWSVYQHVEGARWIASITGLAGFAQYEFAEVGRTDDFIDLERRGMADGLVIRLHRDRVETGRSFDRLNPFQSQVVWKGAAPGSSLSGELPESLLSSVRLDGDSARGKWMRFGTRLVGRAEANDFAQVDLACDLQNEYRLTAVVLPMKKDDGFYLGLPAGGAQALLTIDGEDGRTSGLSLVDGQAIAENATTRRADFLREGRTNVVVCTVKENHLEVVCNNVLVASWDGAPERLALPSPWKPSLPPRVFLGSRGEWIQITELRIEPLKHAPMDAPAGLAGGKLDLLKQIDLSRDAVSGHWRLEDDALIASGGDWESRVQSPAFVPDDYRISVVATRMPGSPAPMQGIAIGLVVDKFQTMFLIDGPGGTASGLEFLDGKSWQENETTVAGPLLQDGVPARIECTVHKRQVQVMIDGRQVVDWRGDAKRLSVGSTWATPDWRRLFVGAFCGVRFSKWELTAIDPDE